MTACVASHESKVTNFWSMEEKSSFQNFITAYIFFTSKPPNLQKVFLIFIYLFFAGRWCPFYWGKGLHSPIKDRSHREMRLSTNYQGRFSRFISISCVWIAEDISSTNNTNLSLIWFNWMAMIREKDCFFFAADCLLVIQVGKSERSNML